MGVLGLELVVCVTDFRLYREHVEEQAALRENLASIIDILQSIMLLLEVYSACAYLRALAVGKCSTKGSKVSH